MLGSPPHSLICGTPVVQEHVDKPVLLELLLVNLVEAADLVVFADYAREFEPLVVLAHHSHVDTSPSYSARSHLLS